jgi:hypothetical protein
MQKAFVPRIALNTLNVGTARFKGLRLNKSVATKTKRRLRLAASWWSRYLLIIR